jgi:hypothetical protein
MQTARTPLSFALAGAHRHVAVVGASQRSLHYAPIFRLLLKVAVNGTHQCDFQNFCEPSWLNSFAHDDAFSIVYSPHLSRPPHPVTTSSADFISCACIVQVNKRPWNYNCLLAVRHASQFAYLLGLLAMIKCSICSYQCDN